jgi:hypothetical protein
MDDIAVLGAPLLTNCCFGSARTRRVGRRYRTWDSALDYDRSRRLAVGWLLDCARLWHGRQGCFPQRERGD